MNVEEIERRLSWFMKFQSEIQGGDPVDFMGAKFAVIKGESAQGEFGHRITIELGLAYVPKDWDPEVSE